MMVDILLLAGCWYIMLLRNKIRILGETTIQFFLKIETGSKTEVWVYLKFCITLQFSKKIE